MTGEAVLIRPEIEFLMIRGIYFLAMAGALHYLFRKRSPGRQFQMLAGLFPVYLAGALRALAYPPGRKPAYRVNNPARPDRPKRPALLAVLPQLLLAVANAVLPFYALWAGTASSRLLFANTFISAVAIWSLWQVLAASLGRKYWRVEEDPRLVYGVEK